MNTQIFSRIKDGVYERVVLDRITDETQIRRDGFRWIGNDLTGVDAARENGLVVDPMICSDYYFGRLD